MDNLFGGLVVFLGNIGVGDSCSMREIKRISGALSDGFGGDLNCCALQTRRQALKNGPVDGDGPFGDYKNHPTKRQGTVGVAWATYWAAGTDCTVLTVLEPFPRVPTVVFFYLLIK